MLSHFLHESFFENYDYENRLLYLRKSAIAYKKAQLTVERNDLPNLCRGQVKGVVIVGGCLHIDEVESFNED